MGWKKGLIDIRNKKYICTCSYTYDYLKNYFEIFKTIEETLVQLQYSEEALNMELATVFFWIYNNNIFCFIAFFQILWI